MGDVRTLRTTLSNTDGTAPSIQSSAAAMMSMYDKSPSLAVSEWRNVLQTCTDSQLLPLLYVANEVIQISKRNRGNKFLESFSPVLGGSLKVICERDPSVTEKVRRTAKIWGDRRIFSTRFVGELLGGIEEYRNSRKKSMSKRQPLNFSPQIEIDVPMQKSTSTPPKDDVVSDNESIDFDGNNDGMMNGDKDQEIADDNDDPFGDSGPSLLEISNFSVSKTALQKEASRSNAGLKRRRSSLKYNNDAVEI